MFLEAQAQEETVAKAADALRSLRSAVSDAVAASRSQMAEEVRTRAELHAYLACDEGSGFERLASLWEELQSERVRNANDLTSAWRKGAEALDSLQNVLSRSNLAAKVLRSDVHEMLLGLFKHRDDDRSSSDPLPPLQAAAPQRSVSLAEKAVNHIRKLLQSEAHVGTVANASTAERDGSSSDDRVCALLRDASAQTDSAAAVSATQAVLSSVTEELGTAGVSGHLSALLRESVLLIQFLTSRLQKEDVWGDLELDARGLRAPSSFELQAVAEGQRALVAVARSLSMAAETAKRESIPPPLHEQKKGQTTASSTPSDGGLFGRLAEEILHSLRKAKCTLHRQA